LIIIKNKFSFSFVLYGFIWDCVFSVTFTYVSVNAKHTEKSAT